ncbi:39S ribosomal protein L21, mitochondrial [Rhopalosiphum maidis]|uniref:39S ribosomal protein L21, mitochondrial n=1 Tax=Rhopalosiphum maidis TaxID=43146 RepID=UPI000EFF30F1|nr:39S ribosomal protein L21, mitochondrial [Rhopalosiphum maidis]
MLCNKILNLASKTVQIIPKNRIAAAALSLKVRSFSTPVSQEYVVDNTITHKTFSDSIIQTVNEAVKNNNRLFAVVHICGKQFKVTDNDLVLIDGYWPPSVGDRIKLQKVLLVGGKDFTLIGRPVLDPETVEVTATVVDKDLSHTRTNFERIKRKQYMRINFVRKEITMLRINSVLITQNIDNRKDVQEMGRRTM